MQVSMVEKYVIDGEQTGAEFSFIGGKPLMPDSCPLPKCKLCGNGLTFFFQIDCGDVENFSNYVLSVFFCTKCRNDEYLIPPMVDGDLKEVSVSSEFLSNSYQNFMTYLNAKSDLKIKESYVEEIEFKIIQDHRNTEAKIFGYSGSKPNWILEDETPKDIAGHKACFLFGVHKDFEFPIVSDAPGQVEFDFMEGENVKASRRSYRLFLANGLYFFGATPDQGLIYTLTQVD